MSRHQFHPQAARIKRVDQSCLCLQSVLLHVLLGEEGEPDPAFVESARECVADLRVFMDYLVQRESSTYTAERRELETEYRRHHPWITLTKDDAAQVARLEQALEHALASPADREHDTDLDWAINFLATLVHTPDRDLPLLPG